MKHKLNEDTWMRELIAMIDEKDDQIDELDRKYNEDVKPLRDGVDALKELRDRMCAPETVTDCKDDADEE